MSCEHRCDACRLDRIEEVLVGVLSRVDAILAKADKERDRENAHYRQILERLETMSTKMEDLTAQVAANTTVIDSALTLIQGFSAQLDAAVAAARAGDDTKLTELAASLKSEDDALAAAVAANTPGTPPTPSQSPRRP